MKTFFIIIIGLLMWQWARAQGDSLKAVQPPPLPTPTTVEIINCWTFGGEELPYFPGCEGCKTKGKKIACSSKKVLEFIYANIIYPEFLKHIHFEGKILLSFRVEKSGNLYDFKITHGTNEILNKEVLRVVQIMPEWIPGRHRGRPVAVEFHLPIKFKIE